MVVVKSQPEQHNQGGNSAPYTDFRGAYAVLSVPFVVQTSSPTAFARIDETYAAFRQPDIQYPALRIQLTQEANSWVISDTSGDCQHWPDEQSATIALLDRIVHRVLAGLYERGIYAIHAGACVYQGKALLLAGRSGQGKTTLVLGLLQRGFGLLSDEFAVAEPGTQRLLPYRRSIHIRPGTPELIPPLQFVTERPQVHLGGGIEWTLTPTDLEAVFPGCLAAAAPLRGVLLLDGTPQPQAIPTITPLPAALAAMTLVRGTWAASQDFTGGLARIGSLLHGVRCATLRSGALDATTDCITQWFEGQHD